MSAALAAAFLTAIDPTTGHDEEWGKAAPIGLLVLVLLGVAVYFLARSMNRNLKKVPASFDESAGPEDDGSGGPAAPGGPAR